MRFMLTALFGGVAIYAIADWCFGISPTLGEVVVVSAVAAMFAGFAHA